MQHLTMIQLCSLVLTALLAVSSAAAANSSGLVDCTQYQQSATVGSFHVRFTTLLDDKVGPNGYLHAEVSYPDQGWIGFGYSTDGRMVLGYAIIGLTGVSNSDTNPGIYKMSDYTVSGVSLMSTNTPNGTVNYNSTHTVMTFRKRLIESGELTINGGGSNFFMVAHGSGSSALNQHDVRSTFAVKLQSCIDGSTSSGSSGETITVVATSMQKQLWTAHGVFAAVAWGVLAPVAIAASILRRIFIASDLPALWFKIHMTVNVTVFIFTALSFAFAVRAIDLLGKEHFKGVQHRKTGLVIMILLCLQVINGLLRPHLPHAKEPDEDALETEEGEDAAAEPAKEHHAPSKGFLRISWEILHRLLGFLLVGFAWWQVGDGLDLYSQYFSEKNLSNVFFGITGALSAVTLFLYALVFMKFV